MTRSASRSPGWALCMRAQKDSVRQHLGEQYMRTIWGDAAEVLDYLANDDYHSRAPEGVTSPRRLPALSGCR